jgi:malate dehydrogenase (oxaloacetate-decarboxylating)(NADP+)
MINACHISGKVLQEMTFVVNGAGAAGIACLNLIKSYGANAEKCFMVDTNGVIYKGRTQGMNKYKELHAVETSKWTLNEVL